MQATSAEIKFGTDGWRGIISDNFTFANVRKTAMAIAVYYKFNRQSSPQSPVMAVGYDTRFLSAEYAQTVAEALSLYGIDVLVSDKAIPTPALSFTVKDRGLTAGVMITASHNPSIYNGIKIKTSLGGAAGVEITDSVEKILENIPAPTARKKGNIDKDDFIKGYVRFLKNYVDLKRLKSSHFKVLVDSMHGSGRDFISQVLNYSGIRLEFLRAGINPSFEGLRPEPVLENLGPTIERLKEKRYDCCLVNDGDADRIAAFAGNGEFIYPQKILGLLALHLVRNRKMSGGLVKTIVGTNLIDKIADKLKLKLYETPVGFKYISELMIKEDILVGGEEAGGMGFKGYIPERDGILAGLLLLEMMAYAKKPIAKILQQMEDEFGRYYYERQDMRLKGRKVDINEFRNIKNILDKEVVKVVTYDGVKLITGDSSWLIFRGSGTEPIMRVYAEAKTKAAAVKMVEFGRKLISERIR